MATAWLYVTSPTGTVHVRRPGARRTACGQIAAPLAAFGEATGKPGWTLGTEPTDGTEATCGQCRISIAREQPKQG